METLFERLLRERLNEMESSRLDMIAGGSPADFADYKRQTGYLAAIKDIRDVLDEVRAKLTDRTES